MEKSQENIRARIIKASKALQVKAGTGDLPAGLVERAEKIIKDNNEDFQPVAVDFLKRLQAALDKAQKREGETKELLQGMSKPVMELKGNARMFKYDLVTNLANIIMDFIENLETLDDTAIEIVAAHHKTLSLIISQKMSGTGGAIGEQLHKELLAVCQRYETNRTK